MKTKILRHVIAALFAVLFSVSSVGSLLSGWDLPVLRPVRLLIFCIMFSAVTALLWFFRYGTIANLVLTGVLLHFLWQDGALAEQTEALVHLISNHFHEVYKWPVLGQPSALYFDLILTALGCFAALIAAACICRMKPVWCLLPVAVLPLSVCLITTDKLPDEEYLFMILSGMLLLLITEHTRRRYPQQYASLTLRAALPAALIPAVLFFCSPQEDYVNRAEDLRQEIIYHLERMQDTALSLFDGGKTAKVALQTVDLRSIGPKASSTAPALKVTAPYTGTVYLRGRGYDVYTGTTWEASESRTERFPAGLGIIGTLTVTTYRFHDILYTPYYAADPIELAGGCAANTSNTKTYSYQVSYHSESTPKPTSRYTALPEATKEWALSMAKNITAGSTLESEKVRKIIAYVKKCAAYDLASEAMDSTCDDFAEWFLKEADTGYCVHFSTAAAVLLRAAKIPARYVEGYAAHCQAKTDTVISGANAHAWVEYYDSELASWCVLEATPPAGITDGEIIPEDGEDEEETEEPDETEADETGEPDETAAPDNTDKNEDFSYTPDAEDDEVYAPDEEDEMQFLLPGLPGFGSGNGSGTVFRLPDWVWKTLLTVLITALTIALIPLQAKIRSAWFEKRWNTGAPNPMALTRWKLARRMAKRTKTDFPEELNQLALKAKFSQHTLTPEELAQFDAFRQKILDQISTMPRLRKYRMKWWFALM